MSSLQNKLYNYEQTPPPKIWEKVAAALDESNLADEFPSKLYNAEAIPPAAAWDNILKGLEADPAPVVQMSRSFGWIRYAAAAAVLIGLVTFGIIKWSSNGQTAEGLAVIGNSHDNNSNEQTPEKNTADSDSEEENPIREQNAVTALVTTHDNVAARIRKVKSNYAVTDNISAVEPIYVYNEHTPNLSDRYVMLMTPGGDIIRMSKKWGSLICCVSGQEQDENCKDQLKKWQEKIACSPVTNSPGNFMDILSLVSSLNDKEL